MVKTYPSCRHRAQAFSPGIHRCESPKLTGLKLVTEEICQECHYRDHELDGPGPAHRPHLLPCLRLGPVLGNGDGETRHVCTHPEHRQTTLARCQSCADYLFPTITPLTPVQTVMEILNAAPRQQPSGWWEWPNVQEALRQASTEAIARILPYPGGYEGRGIVIAGGGKYFTATYVTVRVLRHVGCTLPIEVWHLEGEVTDAMRALLAPYGVTCINAEDYSRSQPYRFLPGQWTRGWQLKPYAVAGSRFREVLFLDADCYPTRNPEFLFDWKEYCATGAIFWPDITASAGLLAENIWEIFGAEPGWLPLESGQMVINKERCWRELQLTLWYNAHADLVYQLIWGDKDTFNIAWRRLGTPYSMPQRRCDWDTHTILQLDPDGRVLFQHRCQDKFRLAGERFTGTLQVSAKNIYNPRLEHEELCFALLEELKERWAPPESGVVGDGK